jgi:hypothetical protein
MFIAAKEASEVSDRTPGSGDIPVRSPRRASRGCADAADARMIG